MIASTYQNWDIRTRLSSKTIACNSTADNSYWHWRDDPRSAVVGTVPATSRFRKDEKADFTDKDGSLHFQVLTIGLDFDRICWGIGPMQSSHSWMVFILMMDNFDIHQSLQGPYFISVDGLALTRSPLHNHTTICMRFRTQSSACYLRNFSCKIPSIQWQTQRPGFCWSKTDSNGLNR